MSTVWLGLLFFCIVWHFMHQRKLAEAARLYVINYCEQHSIQFLSIAKQKSRIVFDNDGLSWQNHYLFEFSGDKESKYEGTLVIRGKRVTEINLPVYRVMP